MIINIPFRERTFFRLLAVIGIITGTHMATYDIVWLSFPIGISVSWVIAELIIADYEGRINIKFRWK